MRIPRWHLPPSVKSAIVKGYLRTLAASDDMIVLGPFRSELGFEVLYWLPFLNWALHKYGIGPDRCLAISRGGMGVFYPAAKQVDLYALKGVEMVRHENQFDYEQRQIQKQTGVTVWDRIVATEAVTKVYGVGKKFRLLHPSWMYWLFDDVWNDFDTMQTVAKHTDYRPLPVPNMPEGFTLPEKFACVRFYERSTFPLTPEVKMVCQQIVESIATRCPVVVLSQPYFTDDHIDLKLEGPNLIQLPKTAPEENFILQAAVMARCQAFVGTYGGVAQWALRYRKPTISVYAQFTGTARAHLELSRALSQQMAPPIPFEVCDLKAWNLWQGVMTKAAPVIEKVPVLA